MKICDRWIKVLGSLLVLGITGQGFSEEAVSIKQGTEIATKGGDWFTRVRALYVYPNYSSGSVNTIPDSAVGVKPSWTGEFDFGYMITKNLGTELILGTTCNTVFGRKALSGTKIGTAWLLPPTLTVQWRFLPTHRVQPYIGAGVNYTLFYGESCSLINTHMSLKHSWGPAAQFGADLFVSKHWFLNLDLKYIWMKTTAYLDGEVPGTVHVTVNPLLIGAGFGYKW